MNQPSKPSSRRGRAHRFVVRALTLAVAAAVGVAGRSAWAEDDAVVCWSVSGLSEDEIATVEESARRALAEAALQEVAVSRIKRALSALRLSSTGTFGSCEAVAEHLDVPAHVLISLRCDEKACSVDVGGAWRRHKLVQRRRVSRARLPNTVVFLVEEFLEAQTKTAKPKRATSLQSSTAPSDATAPPQGERPAPAVVSKGSGPGLAITGWLVFALGYAAQVGYVEATCSKYKQCYYRQESLALIPFVGGYSAWSVTPKPGSGEFGAFTDSVSSQALAAGLVTLSVQLAGSVLAVVGHVRMSGGARTEEASPQGASMSSALWLPVVRPGLLGATGVWSF